MDPAIEKNVGMLIRAYSDEILNNYNAERNSTLRLKEFLIEPATEIHNIWTILQPSSCHFYYLIFECILDEKEYAEKFSDDESDQETVEIIEIKFFIKQDMIHQKNEKKYSMFEKESNLYCSLLPFMLEFSERAWCPKVYLSRRDILVLQDVREFGYIIYKNLLAFTEAEIVKVLKSLAVMHSAGIVYERSNNCIGDSFEYCLEEVLLDSTFNWFKVGVNALYEIAKIHPKYIKPSELTFINLDLMNEMKRVCDMTNPSLKYRNVLCHRGVCAGSTFLPLNDSDASAIFVDFKCSRYCPPIVDVLIVLCTNLNREERFKKKDSYLKYYYTELVRNLEQNELCEDYAGLSETQLYNSYEEFYLLGLVLRGLTFTILQVPTEIIDDCYRTIDRSAKVLAYMNDNEDFRKLMLEVVEEIIDCSMPKACSEDK